MRIHHHIAVVLLLTVAGLVISGEAVAQKRPNVILIMTDDQGYGDLSCRSNTVLKTPDMDIPWTESVRLSNFHVSPLCSPTRAADLRALIVDGQNNHNTQCSSRASKSGYSPSVM